MSIRIDRVTTRGGDGGMTSLADGSRLPKDAARIEALGAVDELNAVLGVLTLHVPEAERIILHTIQNDLFDLGAVLCFPSPENNASPTRGIGEDAVARLDTWSTDWNQNLPPLRSFILPGGTEGAAHAHLARTVARRAERRVMSLTRTEAVDGEIIRYLNRLSDLLFILARRLNAGADILWQPGGQSQKTG
ncbi:Cobalamin adenosyltransferase family protein [Granulibacter bethesdensis]|uniref:Corrinoid adenosyltransferase n=1 Tax=Granulibacter bethesdensis TaxID=364410 RepID=A0AAN0RBK6_9PROT|nr:cob(I)yrinic acid a,c-diamide adenosyltransferase [Granulibacter bethesdensis]AHJ61839.1 Cobalamin adenosyltransferase family protein [Granulibacter bethesdensis]